MSSLAEIGSESRSFRLVEPHAAVELWRFIQPHVQKLLYVSHGEFSERDVFDWIMQGRFQCWLAWSKNEIEGFVVSEIVDYPRVRKMLVTGCAGDNAKMHIGQAMDEIEQFASENGCAEVEVHGRRGWTKLLPDYEWSQVTLRKVL